VDRCIAPVAGLLNYPDAHAVHWTMTTGKWDARFHKMDGNMDMAACYDK
jgi:hypothetical protein